MCRIYRSIRVIRSASCILSAFLTHFSSSSMILGHSLFTTYDLLTIARLLFLCFFFRLSRAPWSLLHNARSFYSNCTCHWLEIFFLNSNSIFALLLLAFFVSQPRHGVSSTDYMKLHSKVKKGFARSRKAKEKTKELNVHASVAETNVNFIQLCSISHTFANKRYVY